MIALRWQAPTREDSAFSYQIADIEVRSNRAVAELEPFGVERETGPEPVRPERAHSLPPVYRGRGWIGGREVAVVCRAEGSFYRLEVDGVPVVEIGGRGGHRCIQALDSERDHATRMAVLGPGIVLTLTLEGRFSLHAGAFLRRNRAVLVLGDSGAGKSTLAAAFESLHRGSRVADDIVPVSVAAGGRLTAHPRFPQLKLDPQDQWRGARDMGVAEILILRRDRRVAFPAQRRLSPREAALKLIENTVACRLFTPELRAGHLEALAAAAMRVPVFELSVPDGLERLPETVGYLRSGAAAERSPGGGVTGR